MSRNITDFSVGQATHTGLVREKNEDSFGWFSLPAGELFIVADGMGGYAGGQEASKRTISSFKEYFESHSGAPEDLLRDALLYADEKVQEIGQENPALSSCGSTIVAFLVSGGIGYFIHAGDSRLYVFSSGRLKQIGHDHSAVQEMLQAGVISAKDAEKAPKNVITQSLGGNIDISRCVVEKFSIEAGSSYLLCSDGLWGPVPEDRLAGILSQSVPASSKVSLMVSAAIDAGGPDNITAQVVEFCVPVSQPRQNPERKDRRRFALIGSALFLALVVVCLVWKSLPSEPESNSEKAPAGKEQIKPAAPSAGKQGSEAAKPCDSLAKKNSPEGNKQKETDAVHPSDSGAKTTPADGRAQKKPDALSPSAAGTKTKPADGKAQKETGAVNPSGAGPKGTSADGNKHKGTDTVKPAGAGPKTRPAPDGK